jgi:replicative DNA helicase
LNTIQLEFNIIGLLISFPNYLEVVESILRPKCFTGNNKIVYEAILALDEQNIPIDTITIYEEIKKQGQPVEASFIAKFITVEPTISLLDTYSKMLYERWWNKEMNKLANELSAKTKSNTDPFATSSWIQEELIKLEGDLDLGDKRMVEELPKIFDDIEKKMQGKMQPGLMCDTFPSLNKATGGIMPSDYVVIFGNYKQGKTTVVEQIFLDIAFQYKSVGVFNLEMTRETLYQKALSLRTGIDYLKLRNPKGHELTKKEFDEMKRKAWALFDGTKIYVEDKLFDIDRIITKMKAWKKKFGIELFVIDYLGLIEGGEKTNARYLQIGSYSRRLKNLAKILETPIIVLSQANEENKTAESKNPARDADFVISVCKPVEQGINSIKDKNGQIFNFDENHFLITMENSRHGKNKQNFVCQFQNNNFVELVLEYI